ncbi:hypothetical protein QCD70_02465 [Agreia sp. PsM10]|uniref:hypothetical protein n=1 Tax=Agreia sp. PsM10 TaxID=3030533 RepID=UPI00263BAD4F|nr:hypothetical protein [Agreia sp. PsM10]MDN4639099.1 hypothetical protein [Agreia sp. PsM10]
MTRTGGRSWIVSAWSTSMLLQCAAFGALTAVLITAMSPITSSIALASPVAYSLVGSISSLGPLIAARWLRAPGSLLITALVAGLLAMPFTALGFLILVALGLPALAGELVLLASSFSTRPREASWYAAAATLALVLFAISLVVIDPAVMSPWVVILTLGGRMLSILLLAAVAVRVEKALTRSGLRRRPVGGGTL